MFPDVPVMVPVPVSVAVIVLTPPLFMINPFVNTWTPLSPAMNV